MRTRPHRMEICLSDKEHAHLQKQLDISGLSCAAHIRALIMGSNLRARPPAEYTALLRELSAIGNNINQLTRMANTEKTVAPEVIAQLAKTQLVIWKKVKDL